MMMRQMTMTRLPNGTPRPTPFSRTLAVKKSFSSRTVTLPSMASYLVLKKWIQSSRDNYLHLDRQLQRPLVKLMKLEKEKPRKLWDGDGRLSCQGRWSSWVSQGSVDYEVLQPLFFGNREHTHFIICYIYITLSTKFQSVVNLNFFFTYTSKFIRRH